MIGDGSMLLREGELESSFGAGDGSALLATPATPAWLVVKATFTATPQGTNEARERVLERLRARGWPNPVVIVSSNGADGWFPHPAEQTATVKLLRGGSKERATQRDAEADVRAAFASEQSTLSAVKVLASELGGQVVKPTAQEAAALTKDVLNEAAGFAFSALPWWAIVLLVVVGLGLLAPYVLPLLAARRSASS